MGHSRRNYHGCCSGNTYGVMPIGKYDKVGTALLRFLQGFGF